MEDTTIVKPNAGRSAHIAAALRGTIAFHGDRVDAAKEALALLEGDTNLRALVDALSRAGFHNPKEWTKA